MARALIWLCVLLLRCLPTFCIIFVVPDDVPAGFATIFGFSPKLLKGNDHRFGFGFSLGPQADFQVLYELGPQQRTRPLQSSRTRSVNYRQRIVRRRPILDMLFSLGFLKEASYEVNLVEDSCVDNEPR